MIRNAFTGEPYPTPAPAPPIQVRDQVGLPTDRAPLPGNAEAATPLARQARATPR